MKISQEHHEKIVIEMERNQEKSTKKKIKIIFINALLSQ